MNFINKTTLARCAARSYKAQTDRPVQLYSYMYLREADERGEFVRSQVFPFSPRAVAPLREVSTVGFSKAGHAKVPPSRRDGNTFVFGFQELYCCTSARWARSIRRR